MAGLTSQPLGQQGGFNWLFLVDVIVCMILALFFLFYFNRTISTLLSYAIRAYTWHAYRAYIDVGSIQLSLLGGRLFFKSIKYHGHNQTIFIHDGYITWRYWLGHVQDAEIFYKEQEKPRPSTATSTSSLDTSELDDRRGRSSSVRGRNSNGNSSRHRSRSVTKAEAGDLPPIRPILPCRVEIKVSGVEYFLYNQTPLYDNIIANLTREPRNDSAGTATVVDPEASSTDPIAPEQDEKKGASTHQRSHATQSSSESFTAAPDLDHEEEHHSPIPSFLRLFPIQIECKKAAAAIGNENTPSIVTAKIDHASGRIDADEAGSLDLYKLLFKFDITNANVAFKSNADFHLYQLQAAQQLSEDGPLKKKKRSFLGLHLGRRIRKTAAFLRRILTIRRSSNRSVRTASLLSNDELLDDTLPKLPGDTRWQGLARYLDESGANEHHEWDNVEYARFSQIVESSQVKMKFYWDVPGKVRKHESAPAHDDDVNGAEPPDYGLELAIEGGTVNYGPWADRQRAVLQQVFFPASCCDSRPAQRRTPDQIRLATVFKVYLCLEKDVTLRIPTRESSKDWQWQGRTETHRKDDAPASGLRNRRGKSNKKSTKGKKRVQKQKQQATAGANVRPFGWIDIKVLADTTMTYRMDMHARDDGFSNALDLDVKGLEITSSVNHALFLRAGNLALKGDLSNPLGWNTLRNWTFKILCHDLDLFILRDHVFLITDLISDWAAGPPPDFYTFVPYHYGLDLDFDNVNLFVNANDANIVNNPADLDENNFIILRAESVNCHVDIPLDQYRPAQGEVRFDILARDITLDLSNSLKLTLHSLLRNKRLGTLKKLTLNGIQTFFSEQAPGLTDVFRMDVCGTGLELMLYGFLIRYLVNVKENYFGEFLHFKTLEEYQTSGADAADAEANLLGRHAFRPANDLDVILYIKVEDPLIMLPCNIYSSDCYVRAEVPLVAADLRITNYYLDLQCDVSPISISWSGLLGQDDTESSKPHLLIDHVTAIGHRLFGLPPVEPAYVETWTVKVGDIFGECSLLFVEHLAKAGRAFAFTVADRENALPLAQTTPLPSILFLNLTTGSLCVWINDGAFATRIYSDPIALTQNDRADELFSSRMNLNVPNLTAMCVEADSISRHHTKGNQEPAECMAFIQTSVELNMVSRKANFWPEYLKQQQFVYRQDARSRRAQFLLDKAADGSFVASDSSGDGDKNGEEDNDDDDALDYMSNEPPFMPLMGLPHPLSGSGQRIGRRTDSSSTHSSGGSFKSVGTQLPRSFDLGTKSPGTRPPLTPYLSTPTQSGAASRMSTLWSPYAVPADHFSHVNVDLSKVPTFNSAIDFDDDDMSVLSPSDAGFNLGANDDSNHQTFMIRLHPGIRVYVEPRISEPILRIIETVLPKCPVDVVDKFQIDVLGLVEEDLQQKRDSPSSITELNLIVPSIDIRLCNDREGDMATIPSDMAHDQLDLNLAYLNLTLRQRSAPQKQETDSALLLHLTLESAVAKLRNLSTGNTVEGDAIRLGVDDILIWLVLGRTRSVHVSFRDLLTVVSGQQLVYLASVFSKYAIIGTSIQNRVDGIEKVAKRRLKYLTDYLTGHSSVSADPPYLSRMTYILRAFPDHFRNQDSWKIVARFRHIFDGLTDSCRAELEDAVRKGIESPSKPSDILDQWAEWCSWDIPNIDRTHVFKLLLGDNGVKEIEDVVHPTELTMRAEMVRVSVESMNRSSDVSLGGLTLGLQIIPPSRPSGLMLLEENLRTKTIVQSHTELAMLRLNWEILDHADDLIEIFFKQVEPAVDILPEKGAPSNPETSQSIFRQDVHIVLSNDRGIIDLNTMNLRHISEGDRMKLSVIGTSRASEEYGECVCILVSSDHVSAETSSGSAKICRLDLSAPRIYTDFKQRRHSNAAEINLGGSYGEFNMTLEQEILGLLEVIDAIFVDEVAYIMGLLKRVDEQRHYVPSKGESKQPSKALHFNVALMAGSFKFSIAMLQALKLTIAGETANLKVRPKNGPNTEFDIEAHLGEVEYALVRKEDGVTGQRAVFHTPTGSVTVGVQILEDKINLAVTAILQKISLEATSIQSALAILNRPEVQSVLEAIRDQISDLQKRIAQVTAQEMKPMRERPTAEEAKPVIYDVKTTLAGLKVAATAPALSARKARAELAFGFGSVRGVISNVGLVESSGIPNVSVQVQDIGALLTLVENGKRHRCGDVSLGVSVDCVSHDGESRCISRDIRARSDALNVHLFAETACTVVDIVTHVQRKIMDLDLSREVEYLRRLRHSRERRKLIKPLNEVAEDAISQYSEAASHHTDEAAESEATITNFILDLRKIRLAWVVTHSTPTYEGAKLHDLELSFTRINLTIQRQNEARLSIQNLQLQAVPKGHPGFDRAENSALLPEVVFTVKYAAVPQGFKVAFNAAGQALDFKLDAGFVLPVSMIQKSISAAISNYHIATSNWRTESSPSATTRKNPFGEKRLVSLQADARFDGAHFHLQGEPPPQFPATLHSPIDETAHPNSKKKRHGRKIIETSLRAPGIAIKIEFTDADADVKPSVLNSEFKIDASSNTVYPQLVPIILQISDSVKEVMRSEKPRRQSRLSSKSVSQATGDAAQPPPEDSLLTRDPSALIGKMKLNLGLRICQQEFGLSCQPIARVNAKAQLEDIYVTMSTIDSEQFGHFFALSATFTKLGASVQHVYSRDSTFSFNMDSIALSLMNSKHLGGDSSGLSAVLKVAPTRTALNARQIQDLLLFREIWFPDELRSASAFSGVQPTHNQDEIVVQKYQQVSAVAAFPWNATVSIADLAVDIDLGQSIGKSSFGIKNMWACSKKSSTWKQDLCFGLDQVGINSTGRMSGFVELEQIAVRTSIEWPSSDSPIHKAPLIQASAGFGKLRAKSSFDYQPFGFVDVEGFNLLMYNVRDGESAPDRLVAILDGTKVFAFCTATSAAQAVGLYQAFDRLVQEKQTAYKASMRDLEKQLRRKSVSQANRAPSPTPSLPLSPQEEEPPTKLPITLHTDVVVSLRQVAFGAFPTTFFDNQLLKLEASDVSARFAVGLEDGRIYSNLSMKLGQLQAALGSIKRVSVPKTLGDISIDEVISNATGAKGGVILRVPRVVANMQTWQAPEDNQIDYIFKSLFEGKVDVGWNYSRISYIRGMWNTHSRSLATRLGRALPESAVKIRSPPETEAKDDTSAGAATPSVEQQGRITAVVNVPQSRYEYHALEPPIIETPQLRDMGEATPPLEWIGLHRDRLPNVTHQIVIVTLLELAKEVEDAYGRILGSS